MSNFEHLKKPILISKELSPEKIREIIWRAVELNASDIHVNAGNKVIVDVGSEKIQITSQEIEPSAASNFALEMLSGKEALRTKAYRSEPVYYSYSIKNPSDPSEVRTFRVCVLTERSLVHTKTFSITARLNPLKPKSGAELGLEPVLSGVLLNSKTGIALFVGGTGQGKTTAMAGIVVTILETPHANKKIMIFEDPVEISYDYIDRAPGNSVSCHEVGATELNADVTSFDVGLYAALRSKPDILIQGEIRTKDSVTKAVNFAGTGHFLMATLHANDCAGALTRIYNMLEGDDKVAVLTDFLMSTKLICATRLIPLSEGDRVAVREILVFTPEIRGCLLKCNSTTELKQMVSQVLDEQKQSFKHKIKALWENGLISPDEYLMDAE